MVRRLRRSLALAAVPLVAVLAACGSSGGGSGNTASGSGSCSPSSGYTNASTAVPSNADPALVKAYQDYVKPNMPGVPFSLLQCAKSEGKLTWYTITLPDATPAVLKLFEKEFPFIKVSTYSDSGPVVFQKFVNEATAGQDKADVVQTTSPIYVDQAEQQGLIANYVPTSENQFEAGTYEHGVWYPYAQATQTVYMYNTKNVSAAQIAALKTYPGLWSPAMKGLKIAIPPPATQANAQLYLYYLQQTYGINSWHSLANEHPLLLGVTPAADAVASGEVDVAAVTEGSAYTVFQTGAPVAWTVPSPALSQTYPQVIAKSAPDPNAARLFQEFVLSRPAQLLYAQNAYPVTRKDVPESRADLLKESWFQKNRTYYKLDYSKFSSQLDSIISQAKTIFGNG